MRVGVVSDVHNNATALQYALEHLADCELLLNLGDLVFEYRVDPDIVQIARRTGLIGIAGNHEKTILRHPGSSLRDKLAPDDLDYLNDLPASRELQVSGFALLVAHGSPWDDANASHCESVHEGNLDSMDRLASVPADVILLGHTHVPMLTRVAGKLVINPGSCGDARGSNNRLTFAKLDFSASIATVYGICYGKPPDQLLQLEF
jgi:putative phosphoesterase